MGLGGRGLRGGLGAQAVPGVLPGPVLSPAVPALPRGLGVVGDGAERPFPSPAVRVTCANCATAGLAAGQAPPQGAGGPGPGRCVPAARVPAQGGHAGSPAAGRGWGPGSSSAPASLLSLHASPSLLFLKGPGGQPGPHSPWALTSPSLPRSLSCARVPLAGSSSCLPPGSPAIEHPPPPALPEPGGQHPGTADPGASPAAAAEESS